MKKLFFAVIPLMLTLVSTSLITAPLAYAANTFQMNVYRTVATAGIEAQVNGYKSCHILGFAQGTTGWLQVAMFRGKDSNGNEVLMQPGDTVNYIQGYSDQLCTQPIQGLVVGSFTTPSSASQCWANLTNDTHTCS